MLLIAKALCVALEEDLKSKAFFRETAASRS
jgi:hypothetical protein